MSDFFDEEITEETFNKKKKQVNTTKIENVLFTTSDKPLFTILVDEYLNEGQCKLLYKNVITRLAFDVKQHAPDVQILYGFKHKVNKEKDIKSQKGWFYADFKINFSEYIPANSKVLTLGDAILFTTDGNTDIKVECFLDFILEETNFYSPQLQSQIFPIYDFYEFFGKDCFENFFSKFNIKKCLKFEEGKGRRIAKLKLVEVENFDKFIFDNMDKKRVNWDLETTGFTAQDDDIICITMCFDGITGYYIDWKKVDTNKLNDFFKNKYQAGDNLKFDCKFLRYLGVTNAKIDFDNLGASHVIYQDRSKSLKSHAYYFTHYGGYEQALDDYKRKYKIKNYSMIPKSTLKQYATMDAIVSYQVTTKLQSKLKILSDKLPYHNNVWTLEKYYYDILVPATNCFTEIELNGMHIDWELLKEKDKELSKRINSLKDEISDYLGVNKNFNYSFEDDEENEEFDFFDEFEEEDCNVDSNDQLGKLLEEKGLSEVERNKKGVYCVNDVTLTYWKNQGSEIAIKLLELHKLQTMYKTFIGNPDKKTGYFQYRLSDNKIHPNFGVMLTNSGRGYCRNPNLQNVPKHGDLAKWFREVFIPPSEEYKILESDGAGLQLRIGSILSDDKMMRKIFTELSGDMHSVTAQQIFLRDISLEEFLARKKEENVKNARFKAKAVNFQLEFGASSYNFAKTVIANEDDWTKDDVNQYIKNNKLQERVIKFTESCKGRESLHFINCWAVADHIRDGFFKTYNGLHNWIESTTKKAMEQGFVISEYGAIRRLPKLLFCTKETKNKFKNELNISLNSPVQNFEASLMMSTIVHIHTYIQRNNLKTRVVGNVHDSIVLYLHKDEVDEIITEIKSFFEKPSDVYKGIPLIMDSEISDYYEKGQLWGYGKEY